MGQKKVNKANDAFGLKKSREQNNQKNDTIFSNKPTNHLNKTALNEYIFRKSKRKKHTKKTG